MLGLKEEIQGSDLRKKKMIMAISLVLNLNLQIGLRV